jgi:hypothetical protein
MAVLAMAGRSTSTTRSLPGVRAVHGRSEADALRVQTVLPDQWIRSLPDSTGDLMRLVGEGE